MPNGNVFNKKHIIHAVVDRAVVYHGEVHLVHHAGVYQMVVNRKNCHRHYRHWLVMVVLWV